MKKTLYMCVAVLGLGFVQSASAATWDGGVSRHVEVKNPDQRYHQRRCMGWWDRQEGKGGRSGYIGYH